MRTVRHLPWWTAALALAACGDDAQQTDGDGDTAMSGFTSADDSTGSDGQSEDEADESDESGPNPQTSGTDGGEPEPPGDDPELCDAGDESWAKRVVPVMQGRRPESIREVRLLVQMVQQLDALGYDGRREVARGLAQGDEYLERWKQFLYEQLRVNVNSDRRNETCYDVFGAQAESTALAEHIRDTGPQSQYGAQFWMGDVVYSSLLLDDVTPAYRADLFARLSAPDIAGNVTQAELEVMRRTTYGQSFESNYLGRKTECLPCHRGDYAVTDTPDPETDRHWNIPGHFELAVYGPDAPLANEPQAHAIFRRAGFFEGSNDLAWGMYFVCGTFDFDAPANTDVLDEDPYMIGSYSLPDSPSGQGATVFHLDQRMRQGFDTLATEGLQLEADESVADETVAFAYMFSMNFANKTWREIMGYPLVVANNFPRNQAQRDLLQLLTDTFADNRYSLRSLLVEIADHPYFNQAAPDTCTASTPYHLPAIFNPFTKSSTDPTLRGNGVGDGLHRYTAMVLLDMTARAMWWDRPQRFGPADTELPGVNCGAGANPPCQAAPTELDFLRDTGVFLNDSESGFNGVDFNGLLHWETRLAGGEDPTLGGACTGPLGSPCAAQDWIAQLVAVAADSPEATLRDVMVAVKDRLLTETEIAAAAEIAAIEELTGVALDDTVADVGAAQTEAAARLFAGLLMNTPQYLLDGIASPDQDPATDPVLVVPGTGTAQLCEFLGEQVLGSDFDWTCSADGITISG